MNFLKIITVANWLVIAFLGYLMLAETLFPTKGGDAAGRGMGQAIYYLAIIALVVFLGLNLLPYKWAKYTAFALIAVPFLFFKISPFWSKLKREMADRVAYSQPIFPDKERDQVARAIRDGEPEKVAQLLQTPLPSLNQNGDLLGFAIVEANSSAYKPAEKLECVRLLFQAGARLDSIERHEVPQYFEVASTGNAALLRLLLEKGAKANAIQVHFKRHILFEAIDSYKEPVATVQALLDFGANPNVTAVLDDEQGPVSPLVHAADMGRWGVCVALLTGGGDPNFVTKNGQSLRTFVEAADRDFHPGYYGTQEDFDRLKAILKQNQQ